MIKKDLNLFVPTKAPSFRQQKVAKEIRFFISSLFSQRDLPTYRDKEGKVKALPTSVTITEVTISADLKHATCFYMLLDDSKRVETESYLSTCTGYFRKRLSQHLNLRFTPEIRFTADTQPQKAERIDEILRSLQEETVSQEHDSMYT